MNNDLIVNLPFASRHLDLWMPIIENVSQNILRSAGRAKFLKIDCLLNGP
jgi:hypothetical protein